MSFNIDQFVSNLSALTVITLMFGMGLSLKFDQVTSLWRQPVLLITSLVAVLVLIPLAAFVLVNLFHFHEAVRVAILLASAVAGSGVAPKLAQKAGGSITYAVSLMATLCILAVVSAPLTVSVLLQGAGSLSPVTVAQTVLVAQLIPLFIGLAINTWWILLRNLIVNPVNKAANVLFPVLLFFILVTNFQSIVALLGTAGLLAIALLVVICLVVGHLLGGRTDATRTVLAITNSQRNLGLGFLVAAEAFPASLGPLAAYGAVQAAICMVYVAVMAKRYHVQNPVQEEYPDEAEQGALEQHGPARRGAPADQRGRSNGHMPADQQGPAGQGVPAM